MLPSLKELTLTLKRANFFLMADETQKDYLDEFVGGARFSSDVWTTRDFTSWSEKIPWIARREGINIASSHEVSQGPKMEDYVSVFEKELSIDGFKWVQKLTLTGQTL